MTTIEPPPDAAWSPPGVRTLWGSHLSESRIPPFLAASVAALTLVGLACALLRVAFPVTGFLEVMLPWTSGLCALLIAAYAWACWLARGGLTALLLAGLLPVTGALAGWEALGSWPGGGGAAGVWLAAGLVWAAGLQLTWAELRLARRLEALPRGGRLRAAALLLLGGAAAALLLLLASPWLAEHRRAVGLLVLALLAAAVPAVSHHHRLRPGLLTHALLVSLAPQIAAQIAALASGGAGLMARGGTTLALVTLFAGMILDTVRTERSRSRIQDELSEVVRELETSASTVQHVSRELEREQSEKERYQRPLRLLSLAVERMSVGLTITDPEGRIVYVNPADAAMHGYSPEELLGQPSRIYGTKDDGPPPDDAPDCWRREVLNSSRDGRIFPVRLISDGLLDEEDRLQAVVTICEDITEIRRAREVLEQAQAELAAREADFRQLVEGASDLIQSVGPDGSLRFVNHAWLEALGYTEEEVAGLNVWDILHPDHHRQCQAVLERIFGEGRPERVETIFRAKSGKEIQVEGNVGVRSEDGRVVATTGIFRDISERHRVERMKQEFLAVVSHELRTPLTSMLGSLGLLRSPRLAAQPEKVKELLRIAERNGERLLRLINDLLDLQRLEAGELGFQPAPVRLGSLLEEAVHDIRGYADLYGVRVRAETGDPAAVPMIDRNRLAQVLYNLLSNAIKFSPAGEEVVVAGSADGGRVELTVRDHGPGIPEDFRARLFEKFAQADASQERRHGGTGLGLSICKKLVEGMGGTIRIDNPPSGGTFVAVRLPAA